MESDNEALHTRGVTADGSAFEEYDHKDDDTDDRLLLDASVISNSSIGGAHARELSLSEPYDRYKSIELRAECYRRGTRPTRSGPKANDNKAGYMALLRVYDLTQDAVDTKRVLASNDHSLLQHQPPQQMPIAKTAKKRKLSFLKAHTTEDSPSTSTSSTTATTVPTTDESQHASAAKRRVHSSPSYEEEEEDTDRHGARSRSSTIRDAASAENGTNPTTPAVTLLSCDPELATEYVQLKMQLLLESREIEKTIRLESQRFKLHAEVRGVVATLAQLRGLAKEYVREHDAVLLADVNDDIAYFMDQKRKLKLEVSLLDRYR